MMRKPLVLSFTLALTAAACTTSEAPSGDEAVKTEVKASPSPQVTAAVAAIADGKQKDGSTAVQSGEALAKVEAKPTAVPSAEATSEASVTTAVVAVEAVKGVSMEVTASRLNVRSSGTMAAPILRTISRGTIVSVIGKDSGFAKIAEGEYVSEKYLRNVTEVAPVKADVAAVKAVEAISVAAPDAVDSSKK